MFYKIVFLIFFSITSNYAHSFDLKKLGDSLNKELGGKLNELEKELNKNLNSNSNTQSQQKNLSTQNESKKNTSQNYKLINKKYLQYLKQEKTAGKYNGNYNARCRYKTENILEYKKVKGTLESIDKQCTALITKWKKQEADWIALKKKNAKIRAEKKKREEDKKKQIIASAKNRESRGKWGVRFNMLHKDLVANGFKKVSDTAYMNDKDYTFVKTNRKGFPYKIYRSMDQYTSSGFSELKDALSKYKLLIKPTSTQREKFITNKGNLNYYYKNEKKDSNPMYIELFTARMGRVTFMYVGYLSQDFFEKNIMKAKNKKKKTLKDL